MTDYTAFEQNIKTRTKILHTSLGYVVDALAVAAFGAACGMIMGLTGLPTLLFLALEFYLIYQFHMDIEMGQLHHAEMIFCFFAFFVGISLSPILGLANITLGFTSIICAMAITLLILGLTSTIASITARQYLDDTILSSTLPKVRHFNVDWFLILYFSSIQSTLHYTNSVFLN